MDKVIVTSLYIDELFLSPAPWSESANQPAFLDLTVYTDTSRAGATDDLQYSTSYVDIAEGLRKYFTKENFNKPTGKPFAFSAYELAEECAKWILFRLAPKLKETDRVQVTVSFPDALLHQAKLSVSLLRELSDYRALPLSDSNVLLPYELFRDSKNIASDSLLIEDFVVPTIIGLHDFERKLDQPVIVTVESWAHAEGLFNSHQDTKMAWCAKTLQNTIWGHVRSSHPLLLETLCPTLSKAVISATGTPKVRVRIDKAKAVMWTNTTAVETTRHRNFFSMSSKAFSASKTALGDPTTGSVVEPSQHTAYIAIGSNVGDRASHISRALVYLNSPATLAVSSRPNTPVQEAREANYSPSTSKIIDTSFLYESEPMYVLEQERFLNGVCKVGPDSKRGIRLVLTHGLPKISTTLTPPQLLSLLKQVENTIGRRKTIEKGPREIDLDVLLYDDHLVLRDDVVDLTIPHPLIQEREFVLRPLADIAPDLIHPRTHKTIRDMLSALTNGSSQLCQVAPLPNSPTHPALHLSLSSRTLIMSILNLTPDSFSDGGSYNGVSAAVEAVKAHVASGADIIDIGGVSTRPGSSHVDEAEELRRVIPVIQAIRKEGIDTPISVDTFRSSVARVSIQNGANIINDISGGLYDPDMYSTIAELDCPFILMHMRGQPEEVNNVKHQTYENGDVVAGVRKELAMTVREALKAGVKRWNIILDPGVGFSKNMEGNLALVRSLPEVTGRQLLRNTPHLLDFQKAKTDTLHIDADSELLSQFPVLLGVSRKGFIGKALGQADAKKREFGNSAIHALAIANGANILRVHDVDATRDTVRMADAIYGRK